MAQQLSGSVAGWAVMGKFDEKQVVPKETSMTFTTPKAATELHFVRVGNLLRSARTGVPFVLGPKADVYRSQIG